MPQGQAVQDSDIVLVALGGNAESQAGDALETAQAALVMLAKTFSNMQISRLYKTPAFPAGAGPDFVNAACGFRSSMPAEEILAKLHEIEADFGRERVLRWGQRTLDLDLIAHGQQVAPDLEGFRNWQSLPLEAQKTDTPTELILPHPRLQDRPFVLVPLADVAPNWPHPVLGKTVLEMLDAHSMDARAEIVAI